MIRFFGRRAVLLLVTAACPLALGSPRAQATDEAQAESAKAIVVDFCEKAFNQKDFEAAKAYFGPQFVDHNPEAPADGIEGIKRFLGYLRSKFPLSHFEIKRVLADGDYVIVHGHGVREPGTRGRAVMDIFRLEQGKIVEHWDVAQEIPEQSRNPHPFF